MWVSICSWVQGKNELEFAKIYKMLKLFYTNFYILILIQDNNKTILRRA